MEIALWTGSASEYQKSSCSATREEAEPSRRGEQWLFLSLDGSMEPPKTCLKPEPQPTGGQAATALPDTGPGVFGVNSLCLGKSPGSSRQEKEM